MAIQSLVLGSRNQERAALFVASMRFVFREVRKLDHAFKASYQVTARRVQLKNPDLNADQVYEMAFRHKPLMVRFLRNEKKKAIFHELLILQISGWMKSCVKIHSRTLGKYSKREPSKWVEKFLEVGPRHSKLPWAQALDIASNYARHKEEWYFEPIEVDSATKQIRTRKNIIETLQGDKPKKNARYLLKLGVAEDSLFGSVGASTEILELTGSDSVVGLSTNCEAWLKALNAFAEKELFKLI